MYEGEWSNNLRHGNGTYVFSSSGAKYVGTWVNGRREGTGELVFANYKFKGHFSSDKVSANFRIVPILHSGKKFIFYFSRMELVLIHLISAANKMESISLKTRRVTIQMMKMLL